MSKTGLLLILMLLLTSSIITVQIVIAQVSQEIYINSDGTITGTDSIQRNVEIYTLTGNISGSIHIQKSSIILDGASYAIIGNGIGTGVDLTNNREQDISRPTICNVTVKNLKIINFSLGIENTNAYNNTLIGNYIENCSVHGIRIAGSNGTAVMYNTLKDTNVYIFYVGSNNNITRNNFMNSQLIVYMYLQPPLVDRNYWSNYTTRYPDAKEIGNTGVWDTPYYVPFSSEFTDYHPLTKPITNSSMDNQTPNEQDSTIPTKESFPIVPVVASISIIAIVSVGLVVYFKKRKKQIE